MKSFSAAFHYYSAAAQLSLPGKRYMTGTKLDVLARVAIMKGIRLYFFLLAPFFKKSKHSAVWHHGATRLIIKWSGRLAGDRG